MIWANNDLKNWQKIDLKFVMGWQTLFTK